MMTTLENFSDLQKDQHWDIHGMSQEELYRAYSELDEKMTTIYRFVLSYSDYINTRHNYSTEYSLTMLEIHLLTNICDNPGITVTELAKKWHRSVSATSQTIRRLIAQKLIVRENNVNNRSVFFLKPTQQGFLLSDDHKRYDVQDIIKTMKCLMKTTSFDEIENMFYTLKRYVELIDEGVVKKNREHKQDVN